MSESNNYDILGGILEEMDAALGQPQSGNTTSEQNQTTGSERPEPAPTSQPGDVAETGPNMAAQQSQLDQITAALSTLTQNMQVLQQRQQEMTVSTTPSQESHPPPYKGKGKGKGKSSARKSTENKDGRAPPPERQASAERAVETAPRQERAQNTTTNSSRQKSSLENYKIPKRSASAQQKDEVKGTPPPKKQKREEPSYDLNQRDSEVDYDENDDDSEFEYDIEFASEDESDSVVDKRIEALLNSPPRRNRIVVDDQQPSTSRGNPKPTPSFAPLPDLEQGELPEEDLDLRLAEIAQELATDDDVGPDVMGQLASIFTTLLSRKMPADRLKEKIDQNSPPANVPMLHPPRVNDTIWNTLNQPAKELDIRHKKIQLRLTRGLTALARLTEVILRHKKNGTMPDMNNMLERAMGAFAMLANANYELSLRRREAMRTDLNPRFARLCFPSTPITTDLFGDEIPRMVEDIQRSHKLERNLTRNKRGGYNNQRGRGNGRGRGGQNQRGGRQYQNNNNNNNRNNYNGQWSKNSKRGGNNNNNNNNKRQ